MPLADRRLIRDLAWLAIVFILSSAWCFTASRRIGATFDEPIYLQAGLDAIGSAIGRGAIRTGEAILALERGWQTGLNWILAGPNRHTPGPDAGSANRTLKWE